MSITYTPTTNFGSKDSLPSNDPNKVIKGAEFTTEFTAIQSAFGLAAPSSNPTFSGTATYNNLTVSGTSTLGVLNAGTTTLGALNAGTTTVGTFTSTGIDDNATSTAITIDANENVGIGTTNPDKNLHISASIPVLKMEHIANNSSRMYFSSSTDGDWGALRASNTSGARTVELTPSSGTGDARFGGLSLGTASATIGGEFATTYPLTVTGSISSETAYPAFESKPTTGNGARFAASANKLLIAQLSNAGAYVSDIYTSTLTDTGPTAHQWFTQGSGEVLNISNAGTIKATAGSVIVEEPQTNGTKVVIANSTTDAYVAASRAGANSSEARLRSYGNAAQVTLTNFTGTTASIDNLSTSEFAINMGDLNGARMTFGRGSDEFMRITDAGTVGIGQSANLTDTLTIGDSGYAANQTERMRVAIGSTSGSNVSAGFGIKTNGSGSSRLSIETATGSSGDLLEVITATSSGHVGIGTPDPAANFHVKTSDAAGGDIAYFDDSGTGATGRLQIMSTGGTGSDFMRIAGVNRAIQLGTASSAALTALADGTVLVGKTSAANNVAGTQIGLSGASGRIVNAKTDTGLKDSLMNYHDGTYVGGVRYTDTASLFPTSSDVRLKDNIVDAPAGNIDALKVRSFDWKVNGEHQEYGFVAQELEAVAPYAVSSCGTEDAMLAVDYSKLVPMLVKEIQDLKAEVEALKNA